MLIRRYKETRRKHPLLDKYNGSINDALAAERSILEPAKSIADYIIDSSHMTPTDCKNRICEMFLDNPSNALKVHCVSFGFKYGIPNDSDLMFDVRCLPNPFYVEELKQHTGLEAPVRDYVLKWDEARGLEAKLCDLLDYLIPLYRKEGKSQLVISVGCTGGRHRSVVFAELLKDHLEKIGCVATVQHRDMKNEGGKTCLLIGCQAGARAGACAFGLLRSGKSLRNATLRQNVFRLRDILCHREREYRKVLLRCHKGAFRHNAVPLVGRVEIYRLCTRRGGQKADTRIFRSQRKRHFPSHKPGKPPGGLLLRFVPARRFIACGTVSSPEKNYHLEFSVSYKRLCNDLIQLLDEVGFAPKYVRRKSSHIVYFKVSEKIEEFLTLVGAMNSTLELMGIKMHKDMVNHVNRRVNFENANLSRTVDAAIVQVEAIEK